MAGHMVALFYFNFLGSSYCFHRGRGPVIFKKGARDAKGRPVSSTNGAEGADRPAPRRRRLRMEAGNCTTFRRKRGAAHGSGPGTDFVDITAKVQATKTNKWEGHQPTGKPPL